MEYGRCKNIDWVISAKCKNLMLSFYAQKN